MVEEEKTSVGVVVVKLCFVLIGTLLPSSISLWLLSIVPFGLAQLKAQAFLLSGVCFFLGSSALIFSSPSRNKGLVWLSGFVISIGAVIVGGIIVLFQIAILYPLETLVTAGIPTTIIILLYGQRVSSTMTESSGIPQNVGVTISQRVVKNEHLIGAVELTEFPEEHLLNKDTDRSNYQPFFNILRVMVLASTPIGLRYERVRNKMRVLYLTWAKNDVALSENLETLAGTVKGNLRGFRLKVHPRFHGPTINPLATPVTTYILGEPLTVDNPRQSIDATTVMAEVLLGLPDGIFQVTVIPKRSRSRTVKNLENQYRTESERAQLTISKPRSTLFSGEVQESKTRTDMGAVKKAESLQIQIDRHSNSHLCEVEVSATCWDRDPAIAERHSKKLTDILRGTLIPADPQKHLSIEVRKDAHEARRLIEGEPIGKTSLLTLGEASTYFSLAKNDLGISVTDHASFHTNPSARRGDSKSRTLTNAIRLGQVLDDSGNPTSDFVIPTIDLASHAVIGGDVGNGKSVTESIISLELNRLGINFSKLLLSKHEDHIRFLRKDKGIHVLTPGDETVTPIRFSFSDFCEGMHVNSVINDSKDIIIAAMPAHGIIKEYMERVIELTFERLGWDRKTNTPGLPIIPSDFMETLPLIKDEVQYSTRGNEDVWGALCIRFGRLCNDVLNSVFGTISGISMRELTAKPSLILLYALSKDEQSFFVFWFVSRIARFFEAQKKTGEDFKKGLKFQVVVEEAHRILRNETGVKVDEEHGAKQAAVDSITTTMKESRSAGLGFTIIAPGLIELTSSAYTMALNIIMHGKGARSDRKVIGDQMNCTDDQIRMIGSLPIGEAVIRTASISRPVRVRITNPTEAYPELTKGKPVTDEEIVEHMAPIFKKNPHFNVESDFILKNIPLKELTEGQRPFKIDIGEAINLYALFRQPGFSGVLKGIQGAAENGSHFLIALIIRNIAQIVSDDAESLSFYSQHLVWSISQRDDIVSEDDMQLIVEELQKLIAFDDSNPEMMERFHRRIRHEAINRSRSQVFEISSLTNELQEAVTWAIKERDEVSEGKSELTVSDVEHSDLDWKLMTLVRTEQFTTRYPKRLESAVNGIIEPLVDLVLTFARSLDLPAVDPAEVATRLLNHARTILDSHEDDSFWLSVHKSIQSKTHDSGSEVAA